MRESERVLLRCVSSLQRVHNDLIVGTSAQVFLFAEWTQIRVGGSVRRPTCFAVVSSVEFTTCREGKKCSGVLKGRTLVDDFEVCAPARAGIALRRCPVKSSVAGKSRNRRGAACRAGVDFRLGWL